MPRWAPDARARLQHAAMTLFVARGYADVTVADITAEAGLTKRSFFNHFADKREVLFAGADAFDADLASQLARAGDGMSPFDAAVWALAETGQGLAIYGAGARARREVIASSPELQEREFSKMASTAKIVAEGLIRRGVPGREAALLAQVATALFLSAYDKWIDHPGTPFRAHIRHALQALRVSIGPGATSRDTPPEPKPQL